MIFPWGVANEGKGLLERSRMEELCRCGGLPFTGNPVSIGVLFDPLLDGLGVGAGIGGLELVDEFLLLGLVPNHDVVGRLGWVGNITARLDGDPLLR